MQPPQGSYPQGGGQNGPAPGGSLWDQPPMLGQWVQRPIPGQQPPGPMPGAAPPPAQVIVDPTVPPPVYGAAPPGPPEQAVNPGQEGGGSQPPMGPGPVGTGYQPPKTGMPRPRKKQVKWSSVVLMLLAVGVAAFAAVHILSNGPVSYGTVRFGSLSALYSGDAVLVRSETVDTKEGVSQIDYKVEEGAQVKRGELVATIYNAGFNAKEWVTLNNYRSQIKEYHKILISGATTDTTLLTRMSQVQARAMEVQRLVHGAQGSISAQEKLLREAMESQQLYIKQKYPDEQKLTRLYDDENTQLQRISTWTEQFAATAEGLVSFYTDGYEKALNMNTYADYSPTQVRAMYNGQVPTVETTVATRSPTDIYRLVRLEKWVVLMLCNEKEWTPIKDHAYNLVIESFDNNVLTATVLDYTRSGGELLLRLEIDDPDFLPNVLYLRQCQVRLGEDVNSLMVPSRAIYVQNGRKGVVMATEGGEYWTGVEVISDNGSVAYVIPDNAGVLYDGVQVRLF